jgi:dinuclear metal center YbgI/SA1388 family protein
MRFMGARVKEIVNLLAAAYPQAWAVAGDHSGFEVGDPETPVELILVALEATPAVVREAADRKAQLLLTHHPLLYRPLAALREDEPEGRLVGALLRAGLALVSCHTNLDVAPGGLNDYLGQRLGLTDLRVLSPTHRDRLYKLTVFVPLGYEDPVRRALGDLGLGVIGGYSHCSFAARGQGTYRPLPGAQPFRGEVARLSRAEESRLEILAPESRLPAALTRLKEVHPYEEAACDLYPLQNPGPPLGLGRLGVWPQPRPWSGVLSAVKEIFGVETVVVWGRPPDRVDRVAVCGGSGGDLLDAAREQGAQLYLTGEVRHHQVPAGLPDGFAIMAVGHFASEVVYMEPWAQALRGLFRDAGLEVRVEVAQAQDQPCRYL